MKKQGIAAIFLIFLFAGGLFYAGLTITERAGRQVYGGTGQGTVLFLERKAAGVWELTFAGRTLRLAKPGR